MPIHKTGDATRPTTQTLTGLPWREFFERLGDGTLHETHRETTRKNVKTEAPCTATDKAVQVR